MELNNFVGEGEKEDGVVMLINGATGERLCF